MKFTLTLLLFSIGLLALSLKNDSDRKKELANLNKQLDAVCENGEKIWYKMHADYQAGPQFSVGCDGPTGDKRVYIVRRKQDGYEGVVITSDGRVHTYKC